MKICERPPHLKHSWKTLQQQHREFYEFVCRLRPETKSERKKDSFIGRYNQTGDELVPYNENLDWDEIKCRLHFLKEQGVKIQSYLDKKKLSLEFLQLWGKYEAARAYVLCAFDMKGDGLGKELSNFRSGRTQSREQMQWFCNYVGTSMKNGKTRKFAVKTLIEYVYRIIDGATPPPPGLNKMWFMKMLPDNYETLKKSSEEYHHPLKTTYHRSNLSDEDITDMLEYPRFQGTLPPINF